MSGNKTDGPTGQDLEIVESGGPLPGLVDTGVAVALAKAEIDQQIATAHAFPRSIKRAVDNIMSLATLDKPTAEECIYALPRAGKSIRGPSVRFAEIAAGQWGNCRIAARVVAVDRIEKFVEAEGLYHDLETNMATTARVRRRIVDSKGRLYNEDMIIVTGNAACSIAKRNAILAGVPRAVWGRAIAAVEQIIVGDIKTLTERRSAAMKEFALFGVKPDQIFEALGVEGIDDIGLDMMPDLIGMFSALKSGDATVEQLFPKKPAAGDDKVVSLKTTGEKLDALAGKKSTPAHDPETGEVTEKVATGKPVDQTAKPAAEKPAATTTSRQQSTPDRERVVDQAKPEKENSDGGDAEVETGAGAGQAGQGAGAASQHAAGDDAGADQGQTTGGDPDEGGAGADTGPSPEDRARMELEGEILQIAQVKAQKSARQLKLWLGQLDDADFAIAERLKKTIAGYLPAGEKLEWPKRG